MFTLSALISIALITALVSALITMGIAYIFYLKRLNAQQLEITSLQHKLDTHALHQTSQQEILDQSQAKLTQAFGDLSNKALQQNSDHFLRLSAENMKKHQASASSTLAEKEKAFESMIVPIKQALEKTEKQISNIEKDRKQSYGALSQHLKTMAETQQALQLETRNLVSALSRPEIRGQWGELTLKRLAELAGMVNHCDFYEQTETEGEDGKLRPDMLVKMPGGREIVVDVKTPLDAYLRATNSQDEKEQKLLLSKHSKNVKERVRELASKKYWSQFKRSPDFVVLFIPGDQFLSSALDQDPGLLEYAMTEKVILATPSSFVALLRAIAYGWRQESLAENAEHIRGIGSELYVRLTTFSEHLNKLGRSLNSSVQTYNKAIGSFDSRILPSAKKFNEMGISTKKDIEAVDQIESAPRVIEDQTLEKETSEN